MKTLPTTKTLTGESVAEVALDLYGTTTFDTTLPQPWVSAREAATLPALGHFVWGYPPHYIFGIPLPLTLEGYATLDTNTQETIKTLFPGISWPPATRRGVTRTNPNQPEPTRHTEAAPSEPTP